MITDKQIDAAMDAFVPDGSPSVDWRAAEPAVLARSRSTIRAMLEAADAAAWEGIETAPRDGEFLVFLPGERREKIQSCRSNTAVTGRPLRVIGSMFAFDRSPSTHWRPLPAPPVQS